jgi:uncharacterized protein (DUF4415 family)
MQLSTSSKQSRRIPQRTLDANLWENVNMITPTGKKAISLRVDSDVLAWFKGQGKGYQTYMNTVLRSFVEHKVKTSEMRQEEAQSN